MQMRPVTEFGKKYEKYNHRVTDSINSTGTLDFLQTVKKGQRQIEVGDVEGEEVNENIAFLQLRAHEICISEHDNLYNLSLRCALLEQQLVTAIESMLVIAKVK